MKKKKFFKNKIQMVAYIIIFIICICLFIYIGTIDFEKLEDSDAVKFSREYNMVSSDNIYKYATASDVLNIVQGRSGVILLGFSKNEWTNYYAYYLNMVAKEVGIKELWYYDFLRDPENSNGTYETILDHLSSYVLTNDLGVQNFTAPTILIIKNGIVLAYLDDTSIIKGNIKPEVYYTDNIITALKDQLKSLLLEYKGE